MNIFKQTIIFIFFLILFPISGYNILIQNNSKEEIKYTYFTLFGTCGSSSRNIFTKKISYGNWHKVLPVSVSHKLFYSIDLKNVGPECIGICFTGFEIRDSKDNIISHETWLGKCKNIEIHINKKDGAWHVTQPAATQFTIKHKESNVHIKS